MCPSTLEELYQGINAAGRQAPVVQTLDSAIHWITQLVLLVFICWIVIYPVDSAIHRLNDWGQSGT